ncbi:MAG TPA: hypothetical protein VK173_08830 [Lacibacter sp.]|nr:hypothetical protein [Lacibacter sp.]
MPYHHSNLKRLALVLFLGCSFLWTKRERLERWLSADFVKTNALVEFGPLPMVPDVPPIPDLPQEEEFLLPEHKELMEQQLELREKTMNELKEKTDRIKIIQAD